MMNTPLAGTVVQIGQIRKKIPMKVNANPPPIPPQQEVKVITPDDAQSIVNYLSSEQHAFVEKVRQAAIADELKSDVRRRIKFLKRKDGVFATYNAILGIPAESDHGKFLQDIDQQDQEEEWGKLSAQDTVALAICFSPENGVITIDEMIKVFDKMFARPKKGIFRAVWTFENFTSTGEHLHAHALVELNKDDVSGQRQRVKELVVRNLKQYKTKTDAYLQIKPVSAKRLQTKLDYVMGNKTDETKQELVQKDMLWKSELGIPQYYYYPDPPS